MKKKILLAAITCIVIASNGYSYIMATVTRTAGKGKDGYELVHENFTRDPFGNCFFNLNCSGNASVQCEWEGTGPTNTPGCSWLIRQGGSAGGNIFDELGDMAQNLINAGSSSGNLIPSGIGITSGGAVEPIFVHFDVVINASTNEEIINLKIYSTTEAQSLGLLN